MRGLKVVRENKTWEPKDRVVTRQTYGDKG